MRGGATEQSLTAQTAGTVALNASTIALNFALALLLSRLLGVSGYGAYASAFAWAAILISLGVLGLTPLVVRNVAGYRASASWGLLRGVLRWANQLVLAASGGAALIAAAVGWAIYRSRPELLYPLWIALPIVPLIALTSIRQAAMQGLGRVVLGRAPETFVAPALTIGFVGMVASVVTEFTASMATAAQVVATLIAFLLGILLLRRCLPADAAHARHEYDTASWRQSALPLVLLSVVLAANLQLGTILLAALASPADAGVFNVATRATSLISFVLLAASYPLMPAVARLYAAGQLETLQRTVVRTARGVLVFAIPTAMVLIVFGSTILGLFGPGFVGGGSAIRILAVGEVVNVLTGYGGLVLVMTGHESDLTRSVALGALLTLGLMALLIPLAAVNGAAIAISVGLCSSNVLMTWLAWRRLGVWTGVVAFGRFRFATRLVG
jgi:O-antigen/teichoic acid export membrane protein